MPDPNPAGPTPIEDVAPGITPVADFIPKDAPISHPTPPPDEYLGSSEANIDTQMSNADDAPQPELEQLVVPNESSLVRPREDDADDEEPAAKRSKPDPGLEPDVSVDEVPTAAPSDEKPIVSNNEQPATEPDGPIPATVEAEVKSDVPVEPADPAVTVTPATDELSTLPAQAVDATAQPAAASPSTPIDRPADANAQPSVETQNPQSLAAQSSSTLR